MSVDPDTLVDVAAAGSEFEASVMVEALKARDIPAFSISNAGMTLQWEVAASQPFRVSVRQRDVALAKDVLKSLKADSVDIDWNEVDVGKLQDAEASPSGPPVKLLQILRGIGGPLLLAAVLLWLLFRAGFGWHEG
ncbi:MAG: hypothetical protein JSS51_12395 [Planctomycetes bacterium]|nr:hypothetical protein [Planctomycetota bacterium]